MNTFSMGDSRDSWQQTGFCTLPAGPPLKATAFGREGKPVRVKKVNVGPTFQPAFFDGPAAISYVRPGEVAKNS